MYQAPYMCSFRRGVQVRNLPQALFLKIPTHQETSREVLALNALLLDALPLDVLLSDALRTSNLLVNTHIYIYIHIHIQICIHTHKHAHVHVRNSVWA